MLIQFDYQCAVRQAARVDDAAEDVRRLATRELENMVDQLSVCWKGESAELYFAKCRELQSALEQTARDLESVASNIRHRSRKIRDAELAAMEIAQNAD